MSKSRTFIEQEDEVEVGTFIIIFYIIGGYWPITNPSGIAFTYVSNIMQKNMLGIINNYYIPVVVGFLSALISPSHILVTNTSSGLFYTVDHMMDHLIEKIMSRLINDQNIFAPAANCTIPNDLLEMLKRGIESTYI